MLLMVTTFLALFNLSLNVIKNVLLISIYLKCQQLISIIFKNIFFTKMIMLLLALLKLYLNAILWILNFTRY